MTSDAPDDAPDGRNRYGTDQGRGRNDPSLYGAGVPGAPPAAHTPPENADEDTVDGVMEDARGVGPAGSGAFVAGAAAGVMGAAADASGAASMGSGRADGGMGAPTPDVDGNDAGEGDAALPAAPGTAVSGGGPVAGSPAGTGPDTPAV